MYLNSQQKAWHIVSDHISRVALSVSGWLSGLRVALNVEYGYAHSKGEETEAPTSGIGLKEPRELGQHWALFVLVGEAPPSIPWTPAWV